MQHTSLHDARTPLSRVLVAVDFSKPARHAFEYALALSKEHGAELIAIQAVPPNQAFNRHGSERLALSGKLRRKADVANVPFRDAVQHGDPARVVLLHARSLDPDLIVMGTHQRRGLERVAKGSVAERVAANSNGPVLVVPYRRRTAMVERFSHVAVGVDFGAASTRAVERAMALARNPGDRLTLLHVVPGFASGVPPHLYRYGIAEYQNDLVRRAYERLQRAVPDDRPTAAAIHARILIGDTTDEISRVAQGIGANVLIVGAPTRGILSRTLFGSTAARLLRATGVPLLIVPDGKAASAAQDGDPLQRAA